MPRVRVTALATYPVKGCRGVPLRAARVLPTGLEWDRHWMIVDGRGRFVSQRTRPQLATITATVGAGRLRLAAEGHGAVEVALEAPRAPCRVSVWKDECEALDEGEAPAAWLAAIVGEPVRLVRAAAGMRRANPRWTAPDDAPVDFADGYPVLVTSVASLAWLNAQLPEPVPMDRFRPNVVIDGLEAFAEDHVDELAAGALRLRLVKPCTRCVVPSLDQSSGQRGADPVAALRATRYDRELAGITFGENAIVAAGAGSVLAVGDLLEAVP